MTAVGQKDKTCSSPRLHQQLPFAVNTVREQSLPGPSRIGTNEKLDPDTFDFRHQKKHRFQLSFEIQLTFLRYCSSTCSLSASSPSPDISHKPRLALAALPSPCAEQEDFTQLSSRGTL